MPSIRRVGYISLGVDGLRNFLSGALAGHSMSQADMTFMFFVIVLHICLY